MTPEQLFLDAFLDASTPAQLAYAAAALTVLGVLASFTEPHVRIGGSRGVEDGDAEPTRQCEEFRIWIQNIEDVKLETSFHLEVEVDDRIPASQRAELVAFLFHGSDQPPTTFAWDGNRLVIDSDTGLPALAAWLVVVKVPRQHGPIKIHYQRPPLLRFFQGGAVAVNRALQVKTFGRPLRADRATLLSVGIAILAYPHSVEAFRGDPYAGTVAGILAAALVLLFGAIAFWLCRRETLPIVQGFVGWDLKILDVTDTPDYRPPSTGALKATAR